MGKYLVILGGLLLLCGVVRADDVSLVGEYDVSGLATIFGANACPPAPICAETLSFAIQFDETYDPSLVGEYPYSPGPYAISIISETADFMGPLGQFSGFINPESGISEAQPDPCDTPGTPFTGGDANFIPFFNQQGAEIDLHVACPYSPTPFTPTIISADLFSCGDAICSQEFSPNSGSFLKFDFGEVEATTTAIDTPEPSSLLLLGAGLPLLG